MLPAAALLAMLMLLSPAISYRTIMVAPIKGLTSRMAKAQFRTSRLFADERTAREIERDEGQYFESEVIPCNSCRTCINSTVTLV